MRLNFSSLSTSIQKQVGHVGQGGTFSVDTVSGCPTKIDNGWDMVGQMSMLSHVSHHEKNKVGQIKASVYMDVPLAPYVPPQICKNVDACETTRLQAYILHCCPKLLIQPQVIIDHLLSVDDEQDLLNGKVGIESLRLHIELWCAKGMPHKSGKRLI